MRDKKWRYCNGGARAVSVHLQLLPCSSRWELTWNTLTLQSPLTDIWHPLRMLMENQASEGTCGSVLEKKGRKLVGGGTREGGNVNWKKEFLTSTGFGLGLQCILYLLWRGSRQSWQCHRNWTENVKYCWNFECKPYYLTNFVVFLNCSVPRGGLLVVSASASWCRFWFYMGIHVFQENNKCHPKTTGCRIFFIFSLLF